MMKIEKDAEREAYLSSLLTLEICAELHKNSKPNTALRNCIKQILPSLNGYSRVRHVFADLATDMFPLGRLSMLRRRLEEMAGGKVVFN